MCHVCVDPAAPWSYEGDEREAELVHFLETRGAEIRGVPDAVIDAIGEYKTQVGHLMVVGERKGRAVEKLIRERKQLILELGAYIGYSAVYFAKVGNGATRRVLPAAIDSPRCCG
jgi:predicted O-methyltransferase YrrM